MKYKVVHESPTHFVVNDGKAHFKIAKQGLKPDMISDIQSFAKGGEVKAEPEKPIPSPEPPKEAYKQNKEAAQAIQNSFSKAFGFSSGGQAQQPSNGFHFHFYNGGAVPVKTYADGGEVTPVQEQLYQESQAADTRENFQNNPFPTGIPFSKAPAGYFDNPSDITQNLTPSNTPSGVSTVPSPENLPPLQSKEQAAPQSTPSIPLNSSSSAPSSTTPQINNPSAQFNRGEQEIRGGLMDTAEAKGNEAKANEEALKNYVEEEKKRQELTKQHLDALDSDATALRSDILSNKVDPNRYWANKSTGGKIATALGLIFSGIGSGMTGQPNLTAAFLDKAIQADIEAQKTDQGNKVNMFKLGLDRYKDETAAAEFATLQAHNILKAQIEQNAAKNASPLAAALAKQALGELDQKDAPLKQNLSLIDSAMKMAGPSTGGTSNEGVNLNKLNMFETAGLMKPDEAKMAREEAGHYDITKNLLDMADEVFEKGQQTATYSGRALPHWFPTTRESTKQYDAITGGFLDKLTRDTAGRVTPTSVDLIKNSLPVAGDSPETIATKKNIVQDTLRSIYAYPTLKSKGLVSPSDAVLRGHSNQSAAARKLTPGPAKK